VLRGRSFRDRKERDFPKVVIDDDDRQMLS
jgi:hypothetical protein